MHEILRLTLDLLDESTDTDWSHATVDEMKQLLTKSMDALKNGKEVDKLDLKTAFAPTSSLQEIAMANNWHQQYLDLSVRFDGLIEGL